MEYVSTEAAIEFAHNMDIQSGYDLYTVFEGFKHRGIALDASLRSAVDGFSRDIRDQILRRLLKEADQHHSVVAAFTQEDVYLEKTAARSDRKLMLWQDIRDDRSNLYAAANAAQQLLSNIGCNRYRANTINRIYRTEGQRKTSVMHSVGAKLIAGFTGKGVGATVEAGSSRTDSHDASHSQQTTYTEQTERTDGWEFAMPYFRELGQKLDLLPPQTLLEMTSDSAIKDDIAGGTLDEKYQRLRSTEVILLKAVSAALPSSMKKDSELRFLLDNGYLQEAFNRVIAKEYKGSDADCTPQMLETRAEVSWMVHTILYAALYKGARQRIEDTYLNMTAKLIKTLYADDPKELVCHINRNYSECPLKGGYLMHANVNKRRSQECTDLIQNVEKITKSMSMPTHFTEDVDRITITGWPDLCSTGINCADSDSAATLLRETYAVEYPMRITTPIDAVMLDIPKSIESLRSRYAEGMKNDLQRTLHQILGPTQVLHAGRSSRLRA